MAGEAAFERVLREVADLISQRGEVSLLWQDLVCPLRKAIHFDCLAYGLHDSHQNVMRMNWIETGERHDPAEARDLPLDDSFAGWVWQTQQPLVLNDVGAETRFHPATSILMKHGIRSYCIVPLTTARAPLGALGFGSKRKNTFVATDLKILNQVA